MTVRSRLVCRHGRPDSDLSRCTCARRSRAPGASPSIASVVSRLLGPRRRTCRVRRVASPGRQSGMPRRTRCPRPRPPAHSYDGQRPHPRHARVPRHALGRGTSQRRTRGARRSSLVPAQRSRRLEDGPPGQPVEHPERRPGRNRLAATNRPLIGTVAHNQRHVRALDDDDRPYGSAGPGG